MSLVETEGLILKTYSLAEADKIVVLLTQNEGLVRGVAKGARRLKSRFGGSLEPFSIVDITYFQKEERELVSIRQIDLIKSFFDAAGNPFFLQKFAYLSELLVSFAPPHDPNENLYRMAKVCLETAAADSKNLENIAIYFEIWILRLGGYLPDWNVCDVCKTEISPEETTNLQINFQLQCQTCQKSKSGWRISPVQREIFQTAQRLSPAKFVESTKTRTAEAHEVSNVLKRIISGIVGKELSTEKIFAAKS